MAAGQSSGTGAMTELDDEKVRKDEILSNRDKAQRRPGQSLDGKGVQVDEYKDNPANRRPPRDGGPARAEPADGTPAGSASGEGPPAEAGTPEPVDRPGFDLGGATGETVAGQGLGLGDDARNGRKDWRLPR
ncbi:MAG: hypothetical protein K2X45_06630 [Phreatobacter sp.]|nr:hypothetical protein [Phreatobacter sp.]